MFLLFDKISIYIFLHEAAVPQNNSFLKKRYRKGKNHKQRKWKMGRREKERKKNYVETEKTRTRNQFPEDFKVQRWKDEQQE